MTAGKMVRNVAADVANSLNFYQWYLDHPLPVKRLYATGIAATHGQAFTGFLQLSHYTFDSEHPGASELFRAHEVAHQYWGHTVGFESYRDQWLSEAFAEYSAMMFVQATLAEKGFFEDILEVYTAEQLGSLKGAMSKFARPWDTMAVRAERDQLGPIAAGFRASTARIPNGYFIQSYRKGALVLHMIRTLLSGMSKDQDLFRVLLQRFLERHAGGVATTQDLRNELEDLTGLDWSQFFDQWVYGCDIPTYEWDYGTSRADDGGWLVTLEVSQSDVPDGFRTMVPVRFDLGQGRVGQVFVEIDAPAKTIDIPLPAEPVDVVFNPDCAVLARVKRR
jgi:aminopeptidase N